MARSENNLTAVLQDVADAIRAKTGDSSEICARDFADAIDAIPTGGGEALPTAMVIPTDTTKYETAKANKITFQNGNTFQFAIFKNGLMSDSYLETDAKIGSVTGYLRLTKDDYAPGGAQWCCAFYRSSSDWSNPYFKFYLDESTPNVIVFPEVITIGNANVGIWTDYNIFVTMVDPR